MHRKLIFFIATGAILSWAVFSTIQYRNKIIAEYVQLIKRGEIITGIIKEKKVTQHISANPTKAGGYVTVKVKIEYPDDKYSKRYFEEVWRGDKYEVNFPVGSKIKIFYYPHNPEIKLATEHHSQIIKLRNELL